MPGVVLNYQKLKRNLQKIKCKTWPRTPSTTDEINRLYSDPDFMSQFGMTKHDNPTQFFKTAYTSSDIDLKDQFSYVVFASDKVIEYMETYIQVQNREFLMDSTFKVCPYGPFTQLLIIYIDFNNNTAVCNLFVPFFYIFV